MAEKVRCDHVTRTSKLGQDGTPGTGAAGQAVQEEHGLSSALSLVAHVVAMNDDVRQRHSAHKSSVMLGRAPRPGHNVTELRVQSWARRVIRQDRLNLA